MMKKRIVSLLAILVLVRVAALAQMQTTTTANTTAASATIDSTRQHIALFTPLYLDSAFDAAGNYRYDKNFPKFINPGLEFWEGAQLAIDSLEKEGLKLDIQVYDTRAGQVKIDSILNSEAFKSTNLIIGHVTVNEAAQLARTAAMLDIPFINANLPNDAGVTNNPHYVILNPTLPTHVTGIYRFLQKNYSLSDITVFRKKGALEDRLRTYFADFEKNTAVKLKLKYVMLPDNFTADQLQMYLNSDKPNICIAGSLDANFAQNLCQQLATLSASHPTTIVGMPTWDAIDFEKPIFKGLEVVYGTPFYVAPTGKLATSVYDNFRNNFYSRPSDMVFRGFETLYHFAHLLTLYGKNMGSSLSDKKYILFDEFDIQPVINKTNMTLDYFENKKLYFIKKGDGIVKMVY